MKKKPKYNAWQNSLFMIGIASKNAKMLFVVIIATAIAGVATNLLGLFVGPMILNAIEMGRPLGEFIQLILMFVIPLILFHVVNTYFTNVSWGVRIDIRSEIIRMMNKKLMTTSYSNTLKADFKNSMEDAMTSCGNNDSATEEIYLTFSNILKNVTGFVIYIVLLATLNPLIIIFVLLTTVTGYFVNKKINSWEYRHRDERAKLVKQMGYPTGVMGEGIFDKDLRLFGARGWIEGIADKTRNLFFGFVTKREKIYLWADVVDLVLAFLRNGVAYFYLIILVLNYNLSAANFLLYFTAIGGFTAWITSILTDLTSLHKQNLELSVIREFLDYPEEFRFEDGESLEKVVGGNYELELRNVSFRYDGAEKDTLENINLKIPAGEKLAIVGVNGAGKTTLVKILCGFLDPTAGEVLLNGVNIKTYNRRQYYDLFSAVFQDFSILAASVAENIAQKVTGIDEELVAECIEKAGLTKKVAELPDGVNSKLNKWVFNDAIEFSGGQTQRLMLARALYKQGEILVLDEPTAALDPIAESEIYQKYNDLADGKTAVYISHRLASTGFCDRIILIDGNQIAETGTHDELMALGGIYADMFEIQGKYYQNEVDFSELEVSNNG